MHNVPSSSHEGVERWPLQELKSVVENAWSAAPGASHSPDVRAAVEATLLGLDCGLIRVAERHGVGAWTVNQWVKKAVLLSFSLSENKLLRSGDLSFFDKVTYKFANPHEDDRHVTRVRVTPPAVARHGSFLAHDVVMMPSFVNIGAYVDEGTIIDGWASVGSCAQIGKNVHIAEGVCIGGVLEPLQANPVIIEDNCFIGAKSSVVEGVIIEENSVIGMGVHLGQSTKILDSKTRQISSGRIPAGSVVVAGTLPAADGSYSTACAVIVRKVDAQTAKTSIKGLQYT
jgi:2,3,4,5-tetrahydropyridine-2-carboxylate N-succinyltransferase